MTDDELTALNACSVPHFVIGLDRFNAICRKNFQDKTYLECYRAFIASDDYKKFLELSQSGSGNAQYSADNVEDRQYILDGFIEDFFDEPLKIKTETNTDNTDVIDADFNGNNTDNFVEAVLNSD